MQRLLKIFLTKVRTYLQVHILPMATIKSKWLRAISLLALFIGVFFVINAFGKKEEPFTEEKKVEQTVYWYQRIGTNQYQQVSNPSSLCETDPTDDICAVGFNTELDEGDVNDSMAASAPHKRYVPEEE